MKTVIGICFISLFLSSNYCFAQDNHNFNSIGICTDNECGAYQVPTTDNGYYLIENLGNLYWLANKSRELGNINAKLTKSIVVNENVLKGDGTPNSGDFRQWECIGSADEPYTGTFDGQGHTISGLYRSDVSGKSIGLFGCVKAAEIKNVTIRDSYFYGKKYVGGIVGKIIDNNNPGNKMTTITNCHNYSTVGGTDYYFGGICGCQTDESSTMNVNIICLIERCTNFGLVKGYDYVGGIVGASQHVNILACGNYNKVEITNNTRTYNGAICGYTSGSSSGYTLIQRCFCSEVSARGIVGYAAATTRISNTCYPASMQLVNQKDASVTIYEVMNKQYSTEELKSGLVAYQMNMKATTDADDKIYWYQSINSDDYPVLSSNHGTVYMVNTKCCYNSTTETEGYSNTNALSVLDDFENISAKKPSYSEVGNIEYFKCKICGKIYTSKPSSVANEINLDATVIPIRGDVNGDGKIDKDDVDACIKFVRGDDDTIGLYKDAADYDDNGKVTVTDVAKIVKVANEQRIVSP